MSTSQATKQGGMARMVSGGVPDDPLAAELGVRGWGILADLVVHGAMRGDMVVRELTTGAMPAWDLFRRRGLVVAVPTSVGTAYVPSPRAKRLLGICSNWTTRPELAARQLMQRDLDAKLQGRRWQRLARGPLPYPRYQRPDGRTTYVVTGVRGPRSGTVRRILERYRIQLLREGAVLLVVTRQWSWLRRLAGRSNGLLVVAPPPPGLGPYLTTG